METTTKPRLSMNEFLERIGQLPIVREMVSEQIEAQNADAAAARSTCLAELRAHQNESAEAHAALIEAEENYKEQLANLEPLRLQMLKAHSEHNRLQNVVNASHRELHLQHGESHVVHALAVLGSMQAATSINVGRLERHLAIKPDPEKAAQLEVENSKLSLISTALERVKNLIAADGISPVELKAQAEELLKSAGYKPSLPSLTLLEGAVQ